MTWIRGYQLKKWHIPSTMEMGHAIALCGEAFVVQEQKQSRPLTRPVCYVCVVAAEEAR